ncbi:hypothetical protein AB0D15_34265, partial [Streptomyces sp. NPDC048551]
MADPGVWRFGHEPRRADAAETTTDRSVLTGAVISFLACVLAWSLLTNGYIPYIQVPLKLFTPRDWWELGGGPTDHRGMAAQQVYELLLTGGLVAWFSRLGSWGPAFDRLVAARGPRARVAGAAAAALFVMMLIWTGTVPAEALLFQHLPLREIPPTQGLLITASGAAVPVGAPVDLTVQSVPQ